MKTLGQIPTPYGPLIDVIHEPNRSSKSEECFTHSFDDCMTLAGIYDEKARILCRAELESQARDGAVNFDLETLIRHGGKKCPQLALSKPSSSAYEMLKIKTDGIEDFVTRTMDCTDWHNRAATFESFIEQNDQAPAADMCSILTASLEHLCETQIECVQAAAFYALSDHAEWQRVGIEWLTPIKYTWYRDWIEKHPSSRRFSLACQQLNPSLPTWISGGKND